ncbi:MAG: hypothetical protein EOP50_02895 [Sphingobacteriales bacterium]|nr:MAG: hypothetical protein EOP50_02895 [Sphingobacteriales bacterium]
MQIVTFDPAGSALSINIHFESDHGEDLYATYTYTLWESSSNSIVTVHNGNNFSDDDDVYWLQTPASNNDGRVIDVLSRLKNSGDDPIKVRVGVEVCQGGQRLDMVYEPSGTPATIAGNSSASNQIFIKLKAR